LFVERAFAAASGTDAAAKGRLQGQLKDLISSAQQRGELWSIDWDKLPLPKIEGPNPNSESSGPGGNHFQSAKKIAFSPLKKAQR
jgi:hypothetical protein